MLNKLSPRGPTNAHRLVVFCTLTERINFGNCVVEFPSHAEIRCNGKVVPANLRGIKNKPGTINPPDITPQIIFMPSVTNKVDITFAESKNSYTVTIYLVEKFTVAQLVEKIRRKGMLSKEGTLNKSNFEPFDCVNSSESRNEGRGYCSRTGNTDAERSNINDKDRVACKIEILCAHFMFRSGHILNTQ